MTNLYLCKYQKSGSNLIDSQCGATDTGKTQRDEMLNHLRLRLRIQAHKARLRCACSFCKVQHDVMAAAGRPKAAFTLAEVLITLGIIGIVAAMTIPTIIQKYQEKVNTSRLKKVYASLSQAWLMLYNEYGEPTNWGTSLRTVDSEGNVTGAEGALNLSKLFAEHMKVDKNCGTDTGCWYSDKVYRLDGKVYNAKGVDERDDLSKLSLADGTMIALGGLSESCASSRGSTKALSSVCAWIIVDINGAKAPNTYGRDIFEFVLTLYNVLPYGTADEEQFSFDKFCRDSSSASGNGCTAWVIYNENMDYLHCDDLSWEGKHKCD